MWPRLPETHRSQRGVTLIWMALFLLVMLVFIGIGVDVAKLTATRSQLQNAADAAALAGASAFELSSSDTTEGGPIKTAARVRAQTTAGLNRAFRDFPTVVTVGDSDVVTNFGQKTVTVTTRREGTEGMVTYFLKVIPALGKLNMRATATAKGVGGCQLWPVAGRPDPGPEFVVGCTEYILKYGAGSGTQGSYGALDLDNMGCPDDQCGTGANGFRCRLMNGFPCCIEIGTCVPAEPGTMSGPTAQGVAYRFTSDTDQRQSTDATPFCYTQYTGNGQRIVWVPITSAKTGKGSGCYTVLRYGQFFLTRIPGAGNESLIYANFMGYQDNSGASMGNFHVSLIK